MRHVVSDAPEIAQWIHFWSDGVRHIWKGGPFVGDPVFGLPEPVHLDDPRPERRFLHRSVGCRLLTERCTGYEQAPTERRVGRCRYSATSRGDLQVAGTVEQGVDGVELIEQKLGGDGDVAPEVLFCVYPASLQRR